MEVQLLQDSILLVAMGGLSLGSHHEDHWWHLLGQSDLTNNYFGGDYNEVGTQVP